MVKVYMTTCGLPGLLETELIKKMLLHSPTPPSPQNDSMQSYSRRGLFCPWNIAPWLVMASIFSFGM